MSKGWAVFILMSNYFHDVATAMLVACSFALWVALKAYGSRESEEKSEALRKIYRSLRGLVLFSWCWIIGAGIIRVATFTSFEWINAVEKHHEPALLVKYVIASSMIICGGWSWTVLSRRASALLKAETNLP